VVGTLLRACPNEVSALHVLSWVAGWDNSAVACFTKLTDKVVNGTITLVDAIAEDGGAAIRLSTPVTAIEQDDESARVTTRGGEVITARALVLATPINTWNDIEFTPALEGSHQQMAQEGQAGEAGKVWALVRGLDRNFYGVGLDTTFKWLATEYVTDDGQYLVGFTAAEADLDVSDAEGRRGGDPRVPARRRSRRNRRARLEPG
jgi:glycine/D-amino acid oxidase-like deaminating enzyme